MPTPAEPIREQIVAAVAARLATLTAGAVYWYTPAEVRRDWVGFAEAKASLAHPTYCVIEGPEEGDPDGGATAQYIFQVLTVIVAGWVMDQSDRRRAVNRAIGDVTVAVAQDVTWGLAGVVLMTNRLTVKTDEAALFAPPYAYFEMELGVHYVRARSAA